MGRVVATGALIALAVVAVYAQVARHEFVEFDDNLYITNNTNLQHGLSLDGITWALGGGLEFDGRGAYIWQPVTWLSYLVDYELYGMEEAGPWVLTNVAWHVVSSWILLAALYSLTGRFWPSAFATALFALHPIQVESVAWASGRRDILAGLFVNLCLFSYARYVRRESWPAYAAVMASLLLSLTAKGSQVALPFLLLLLDYWPLKRLRFDGSERETFVRLLIEKLPLLGLSLAILLVNLAPVSVTPGPWGADPPLLERAGDGLLAYVATLGRFLWPDSLAIVYPTPVQMGLDAPSVARVAGALIGLIATAVVAARAGAKRGYLIVGWLWFLGMLFPLLGLIPAGLRVMHDRYAYIPMIGLAVALAFGGAELLARWRASARVGATVAATVLIAAAVVSSNQVGVWQNSLALFDHSLEVTERNAIVHLYKGNTLVVQGDLEAARPEFERALEIYPDYPLALQNFGHLRLRLAEPEAAIPLLERAIELRPDWAHAMMNLGRAQWVVGERERSIATLERALELNPASMDTRGSLAIAYRETGRLEAAIELYRDALRRNPNDAQLRRALNGLTGDRP